MLQTLSGLIESTPELQKEITKKLNTDVKFVITKGSKGSIKTDTWVLRGKSGQPVTLTQIQGDAADNADNADATTADVQITLTEANMLKLARGKTSAQKLYMSGKLKVKGNVMKVSFVEPLLQRAFAKSKL